jgi:hypothetical protein
MTSIFRLLLLATAKLIALMTALVYPAPFASSARSAISRTAGAMPC